MPLLLNCEYFAKILRAVGFFFFGYTHETRLDERQPALFYTHCSVALFSSMQ